MKRDNTFGVWHRCKICGTVFSDANELRMHTADHPHKVETANEPLMDEPEDIVIPSVVYPNTRPARQYHNARTPA